jgi:hypothetical protein
MNDQDWHHTPPKAPGTYWWRKSWQWEPIERRVFVGAEGVLCVASHRYSDQTPLPVIGGEWFRPQL